MTNIVIFYYVSPFTKLFFVCLRPVNIILQGTSILFPFLLFTAFPFIFTVSILLTSVLKKKNYFCKLSVFSLNFFFIHSCYCIFVYSISWFHLALLDVFNDRSPCLTELMIAHHKGPYFIFLHKHNW